MNFFRKIIVVGAHFDDAEAFQVVRLKLDF